MSVSLDASPPHLRLRVTGPVTLAEVRGLPEQLAATTNEEVRPPLLIDARGASVPVVLWTKSRRNALESALRRVGPVAVVADSPQLRNAIKLALNPFGSELIWRMFTSSDEASSWLSKVEIHGRFLWDSTRPPPRPSEAKIVRLLDAVLARGIESPFPEIRPRGLSLAPAPRA